MSRSAIYRPRVQNGPVANRPAVSRSVPRNDGKAAKRARSRTREGAVVSEGAMVLYAVIGIGLVLSAGFVFALRTQGRIHRLGIDDTKLKSELHEMANRQRSETLEQQKALHQADTTALLQPGPVIGSVNSPVISSVKGAAESQRANGDVSVVDDDVSDGANDRGTDKPVTRSNRPELPALAAGRAGRDGRTGRAGRAGRDGIVSRRSEPAVRSLVRASGVKPDASARGMAKDRKPSRKVGPGAGKSLVRRAASNSVDRRAGAAGAGRSVTRNGEGNIARQSTSRR